MNFPVQFANMNHPTNWSVGDLLSASSSKKVMSTQPTDGELIRSFVEQGSEPAFETLFQRYYDMTYRRFLKHVKNTELAADLTQQLWMQMLKNLASYEDDGRFASFLMRSATNLLTDHWRRKGVADKVIVDYLQEGEGEDEVQALDPTADTQKQVELQEQIDLLTKKLIPGLPCEQRFVFLLKHESEYWEEKRRLQWQHLADLVGKDVSATWEVFETTRNALLADDQKAGDLECDALLIFLVWSQSQRPSKKRDFTWNYYAKVLNIPENTLKTRYRAALKSLSDGLKGENS